MHRTRAGLIAGLAVLALLMGCASDPEEAEESPTPSAEPTASTPASTEPEPAPEPEPEAPGITITSGSSQFGTMLYNADNQAIYIWEVEESSTPECYGDCAIAWPPVLTDGAPVATGEVQAGMLGTTERTDGTTQVTYNGHPLYYYVDEGPGEVRCHNVATHGGLWWVIQPNGQRAA